MEWKCIKPLESISLINEYESLTGYIFCDAYILCVVENNGGRPSRNMFDAGARKGCVIKTLLSFNRDDKETVWKMYEWCHNDLANRYIPFGIDNFGNLLCFDSANNEVVFVDMETETADFVAKDFETFIDGLAKQPE